MNEWQNTDKEVSLSNKRNLPGVEIAYLAYKSKIDKKTTLRTTPTPMQITIELCPKVFE